MSATGERTKPLARLVACRGRGSQADSVTGRPVLRLGGDNLTQDSPMTDQAISPLRWRMIEDMAIRKLACAEDPAFLIARFFVVGLYGGNDVEQLSTKSSI
jgi:hypothetical protein